MYSEVSFVISFGLILILILTHFNFKSILFNFENNLKNNNKFFQDKIKKMNYNITNNINKMIDSKMITPIDCEGKWICNDKCIKNYVVDIFPKYNGEECPYSYYDEPPESGPGSEKCSAGVDYCPKDIDCKKEWSNFGSNCERNLITTLGAGSGKKCDEVSIKGSSISHTRTGNCIPQSCEGTWSNCGSNCGEKTFNITKKSIPFNYENCEYENGAKMECQPGDGECPDPDVNCRVKLNNCNSDNKRLKHNDSYFEIINDSKGNGIPCPGLVSNESLQEETYFFHDCGKSGSAFTIKEFI
jgi:hypothetical protein|tara:strand:- start:144 stop:1043 length:900 start_codon:yes stop_codon:yes gene_type:complete